ncbi:DNA-binding response regulator, NarL/FixJ family, contains REC and HTH domains [Amycolatopsis pretoriensis]|uniref:DNA-binding response regulator, NarL/FixJ family, contains REC and HTH domains n=1 Tax=Amycolatopsis pretoriensis TaxID=218821 RepID=A0A1H5RJR5_9PSEU|nr:response regulator transcription factor [Amycolatopsis pretoriensis]SEF38490.1 DNA-binding response regulator, NarL/FixJ family, contains REC and HTH domains [Amycolatopsis pretoriensis]
MRVVIAEDLLLLREGLVRLLEELEWNVVSAVDDPDDLLVAIEQHRPDLSIVDIRLPPTYRDEGLRAAIEARRRQVGTPILILSQYIERTYVRELLADSHGGVGYLLKDRVGDVRQFMADLRTVAEGGTVLDPQVVRAVFDRLARTSSRTELTPREREVLGLMARGLSNSAIGVELGITERAVSKYINRIFAKRDLPPGDNIHRRVLAVLQYLDDIAT